MSHPLSSCAPGTCIKKFHQEDGNKQHEADKCAH